MPTSLVTSHFPPAFVIDSVMASIAFSIFLLASLGSFVVQEIEKVGEEINRK